MPNKMGWFARFAQRLPPDEVHANDAKGRRAFTAEGRLINIQTVRHQVYYLRFAATELSQQLDKYENFDANFN